MSLFAPQSAYCDDNKSLLKISSLSIGGMDVKEFKNLKNIFKKDETIKSSETKQTKKGLKIKEVPLDNSTFSTFEDSDLEPYVEVKKDNQKNKNKK